MRGGRNKYGSHYKRDRALRMHHYRGRSVQQQLTNGAVTDQTVSSSTPQEAVHEGTFSYAVPPPYQYPGGGRILGFFVGINAENRRVSAGQIYGTMQWVNDEKRGKYVEFLVKLY